MSTAHETATYIGDIADPATIPADNGASGKRANSAAEQRKLKDILVDTLPNLEGAVTADHSDLNILDGVTATTADLNLVAGFAAGSLTVDAFPATTAMLFYQDAAPTGWTIVAGADEHSVRLTKGSVAGGQTGGVADNGGTNDFSAQFTSINTGSTAADLAAHTHFVFDLNDSTTDMTQGFTGAAATQKTNGGDSKYLISKSGQLADTANSSSTGDGAGHVHTVDLAVKWAPCIMATKDA